MRDGAEIMGTGICTDTSAEKRIAGRINVYIPLMLREAGSNDSPWDIAFTINVGCNGAYVLCRKPWRIHQTVDVCINTPPPGKDPGRPLCLNAWIVRIDEFRDGFWGKGLFYGIGIQFDREFDLRDLAWASATYEDDKIDRC